MIYLDNNATTRTDERVVAAMLPYFTEEYGNPSSSHKFGLKAAMAVEAAREAVANLLGADPSEVFFTAGATESNNTVLKGAYFAAVKKGIERPHFIVNSIEHKCVINAAHFLESIGADVTFVRPNSDGIIEVSDVRDAITSNTILVSSMWANNEIGSINPVLELAQLCDERGILFHTDAAQAIGKINIDLRNSHIHFLTGSAQKFYGPKGTGLLYVKKAARNAIEPLLHGGGQESGLRSGTLNVPGIVGLAEAMKLFCNPEWISSEQPRQLELATRLYDGLKDIDPAVQLNGPAVGSESRLFNNLNVSFPSINEKIFNKTIKGLMISSGSACSSADLKASYVLTEIGLEEALALKSFRIGLAKDTTAEIIDEALRIMRGAFEASTVKNTHASAV